MQPKVLFGPAPMRDIPHVYEPIIQNAGLELVYPPILRQMTEAELMEHLPGCVASLAGSEPYTRAVIAKASQHGLKIIARAGVGYDGVDVAAATEHGVVVTYAPGSNHEAVGEHAMLLILALAKNLPMQLHETRQGNWPRRAQHQVREKTLGIIGLGRTGKALATRALAFRMNILAHDPYTDPTYARKCNIPLVPLEDVLQHADYLSVHVPLTAETRSLICTKTINLMKPTAFLVNTARGEVIQENDLIAALQAERIAGAALDVFEKEPLRNNPLQKLENVLLTPHTAGVDFRSREDMVRFAAQGIAQLWENHWPMEWIVNAEVRENWRLK
jgi:phosphoglycerate dehydrogenase-like enzyme